MNHAEYRADIDGLRAIAVVSVVIFHAWPDVFKGGFVGVDVFFVVSGFLISTLILDDMECGRFSFLEFYGRRVRRLFPALAAVMAACLAAGWFTLLAADYQLLGKHVAGAAAFASNFVLWNEAGYFDTAAGLKPLRHLWSLGIEEQFYLVWPLLLLLAKRTGLRPLDAVLAIGGISFALNLHLAFNDEVAAFYSPLTRFWELQVGALLAATAIEQRTPLRMAWHRSGCSVLGTCMLAAGFLLISSEHFFPGWWALLPTLGTALIIAAGRDAWANRTVLSNPVLVRLGLISYPLYLWHWPLLVFARIIEDGESAPAVRVSVVLGSLALAAATYRWVERPLRYGAAKPQKTVVLVFAMLALGILGAACHRFDGLPARDSIRELQKSRSHLVWPMEYVRTESCANRYPVSGYCALAGEANPTVALVGDSHANHFYPGLAEEFGRAGEILVQLGRGGCPPLLDVSSRYSGGADQCAGDSGGVLERIAAQPEVHTVILAAAWHLYMNGSRFRDRVGEVPRHEIRSGSGQLPEDNMDVFRRQMTKTITLLQHAGKRVIVIKQIPELGISPTTCIGKNPFRNAERSSKCRVDANDVRNYLAEYEVEFDRLVAGIGGVLVIDPLPYFCDERVCPAVDGTLPLHRDQWHLSVEGSRRFAQELARRNFFSTYNEGQPAKPGS